MHNPSRQPLPITWADLIHIRDSHGVRPTANEPPDNEVRVIHDVYTAWEKSEGLTPGRGYLMPVHLLTGHIRQHLRAAGRRVNDVALRALIVNALNHPGSGLEIHPRPYRQRAAS